MKENSISNVYISEELFKITNGGGDIKMNSETIKKIKQGDEDVFAGIIDEYTNYLAAVINNVHTLNAQDTEDIIADTVLAVWKNSKKLREDLNFKSYLAKIARNKTIDFIRKRRVTMVELDVTILSDSDVESDFLCKEFVDSINRKIKETKEPDRTILILKYHHGLKNKEIANKLDLSQNVVDIRLSRQRSKLKKLIMGMEV